MMCMVDTADTATIYRERRVCHARLRHKCYECGREIAVGEPYHYAFNLYEGQAGSYHTCQHCAVAVEWLRVNCGGWLFGGVGEDIEQHIQEYGWQSGAFKVGMLRLVAGMRRRWHRFDKVGLMALPRMPMAIAEIAGQG